jgi:hypothetical protein
MEDLLSLSRGPMENVTSFTGYDLNGFRYRVESRDKHLCTQNSGVAVLSEEADHGDAIEYYGILTEILELQYLGGRRVTLFRSRWFDVFNKEHGMKKDKHGIVSINPQRLLRTNEPFVLASQVSQVFYAKDNIIKGWHTVVKIPSHHAYNVPHGESDDEASEPEHDHGDEDDSIENSTTPTLRRKRTS